MPRSLDLTPADFLFQVSIKDQVYWKESTRPDNMKDLPANYFCNIGRDTNIFQG